MKLPYRILTLYANDIQLGEWKFEKDTFEEIVCDIPNDIITQHPLKLRLCIDVPDNMREDSLVKAKGKFIIEQMKIVKGG